MMENFSSKLSRAQEKLSVDQTSGWLLYDFRHTNDLACRFLQIPRETLLTRRFFYWIPAKGDPVKIVHRIEEKILDHLPGEKLLYSSWSELESALAAILSSSSVVAMEYSPKNQVPYISKVDAGTVDMIRSYGVEVVTSADLLQHDSSVWSPEQLKSHLFAAAVVEEVVAKAWDLISECLTEERPLSEYDIQKFIIEEFAKRDCLCEGWPCCAFNTHSADPHYIADDKQPCYVKAGDFILIDLSCKQKIPGAIYADITRVAVAASQPTKKHQEIFDIVKRSRDAGMDLLQQRISSGQPVYGWEVDQTCRQVIEDAGYGKYFTHRTGHNIGESVHGSGAHLDNFETKDTRQLLPGTGFSVEPGIYLPGEFGVRLEHNVYLSLEGSSVVATPSLQKEIVCI